MTGSTTAANIKISCSKRRSKPHFGAVEFAQFSVAEEDAMYVLIHLFEADLLIAEHFADEYPALMPTDVPGVARRFFLFGLVSPARLRI
jgi:hypothetical protein